MSYDTWKATDTVGDEQAGRDRAEQQAGEDERSARWETFVSWCQGDRPKSASEWSTLLYHVYQNMRRMGGWHYVEINQTIQAFADAEGWPGVLSALSRAMAEQDSR